MVKSKLSAIILIILMFSGCAGVEHTITPERGTYHKVKKGETLWRISTYYDTDIKTIAKSNRLPDKRKIYVGQLLFIPGHTKQVKLPSPELLKKEGFAWPVRGNVVSFYGSIENKIKNKGIDIKSRSGKDVVASRSGVVSFCDENMKGFGKTIIIDHGDGFSTVYAYNSQLVVKLGDRVTRKMVIAKIGDTGRAQSPRLHFEIRKNKIPKNPFYYLP